jgi:rhodanese-related sulfurtransferase/DNA-binding MarR family transcriptional regulator
MARGGRASKNALFDGFAAIASALGAGRRAEIVEILSQGERTVEEMACEIGQSVANTSHHLRALARAGLVATRRDGNRVHYRLASEGVTDAWLAIRRLAAEQLDGLGDLAEAYLGPRDDLEVVGSQEVRRRIDEGHVVILDVRPEAEYRAGHIPGAMSVPPDELHRLEQVLSEIRPDAEIVAYCRGPYCVYADEAVRWLASRGRAARRLTDGIPEWRRAGGPVEVFLIVS